MTTYDQDTFVVGFNAIATHAHKNAVDHGFWESDTDTRVKICLMHSELSEALEAIRHGNPPDDHIPEFSGVEAEFADVIIRIMDTAKQNGFRVAEAVLAKMEYNASRPKLHGKNC